MKRILFALVAAMLIAAANARASEVTIGSIVKLNDPMVPGCTFGGDAQYAWSLINGYAMVQFVNSVGFQKVDGEWRACTILSTRTEWKIVQKVKFASDTDWAWFCVESVMDFNVNKPGEPPKGPPLGCFWTRGPETDRKALPITQWTVIGVEPWRAPIWRNY
jgi:hypothetical protein